MDIFDVLLQAGLVTAALVTYLIFIRKPSGNTGNYRNPGWNHPLKLLWARYAVRQWKSKLRKAKLGEKPRDGQHEGWDSISIRTCANDGSALLLGIRKLCGRQPLAEITVYIKLPNGTSYRLPQHPDTAVGVWESFSDGWSANGLKIQILEEEKRLRILYNGLLTRDDNVTQHVKVNLIWASGSVLMQLPEDWSNQLAARALALEPWRNDKWPFILGKFGEGSCVQFGTVQGRFQSFDTEGTSDTSVYLRTRGLKDRSWAPQGYLDLRRSMTLVSAAHDGTLVQLRALSYNNVLTECISGFVRFPNYSVESVTSTDLVMSDFCETAKGIPKVYTINVSTKNRDIKLVLRINETGGQLWSGVPCKQSIVYRTLAVDVDHERGAGILELSYEHRAGTPSPSVRLSQPRLLKWLSEREAGDVSYCVPFEDRAAACTNYVGGKGASLALLSSMQKEEGYRVPPGYCITAKALEKHLERNPDLRAAIQAIQDANENYDENNFKDKCNRASELFANTEITGDIKEEIIGSLKDLRRKAIEQELGPERFAVRSSAVGEDSEALSAAGQNETFLGCVSDADVMEGVQKCWGSMFSFTSAYYRRQNGQPCFCGGGVVVQALATPHTAGVMFTRQPDAGDPSRLLITANYGLGESVVSGAVEPDTIIVRRGLDGQLTIAKTELGSKKQRLKTADTGVIMEDVPEAERGLSCLSESEALRLAKIGVSQEELWGAGRDIEWAICGNEIFLLQARPITSLERWTEEELLHELDFPIMADDELTTFANTGEVIPKPLTPLSYDLSLLPLTRGVDKSVPTRGDGFEQSVVVTHFRPMLNLYVSVYRSVPKKADLGIRMLEMAIHGHPVADQSIIDTALHRRKPHWTDSIFLGYNLIRTVLSSKSKLNNSIKDVNKLRIDTESSDILEVMENIAKMDKKMEQYVYNHSVTTTASTVTQFIAMSVLLEGNSDFTTEQCNEISSLLSSGDVLSAEVPQVLAKLARLLEASGRAEEFRQLDPKLAMEYLKSNLPEVHRDVCTFLEQHGHRAIMEFDLYTKPWALVPEEMMKVLQSMRHSEKTSQGDKEKIDVIANLKTPKKSSTRKVLRWVLPLCKRSVRHREGTKAHLILGIHKVRLACLHLGRMLVRHWYMPNADLVFFFRIHELREYIKYRDPALLKKALQRQQYYPTWCKLKFAEINTGWVEPLQQTGPLITASDIKVKATSVCGGEVIARACVVKDLSEIGQLQQGDVLITHATDIGWSPYFPLLTGIVTELGGLISHGAVIAREYGLPCIVGAANATDIFKIGDTVRLSGTQGTIEKVEMADTDNPKESSNS